jgi:hypothetical protein
MRARFGAGRCILGGTGVQAIGLGCAGLLPGAAAIFFGGAGWAMGLTLRSVINVSVRQELTPDALLGRVMAASSTVVFGSTALGALAVTRVAAQIGASHTLSIIGGALAAVVAVGWTTPLARATAAAPTSAAGGAEVS